MALTDQAAITQIKSRYGLPEDADYTITVYRSEAATVDQLSRAYLLGDQPNGILGSKYGLWEEIVVLGEHTLIDADGVYTEYQGD
jgi:hypothetical protein